MGKLAQCREVRQNFPPTFDNGTQEHACVMGGEDVLTLRVEEQGKQQLFVDTSNIPKVSC